MTQLLNNTLKTIFKLILISTSFLCVNAYGTQGNDEPYFLPTFRSGNRISLFISAESTKWSVAQKNNTTQANTIPLVVQERLNFGTFFNYTYHMNLFYHFGFFVGTSFGVMMPSGSYGSEKSFTPGLGLAFPTMLGGLSCEVGESFILTSGIEYGIIYYPNMVVQTSDKITHALSPTLDMINTYFGIQYFIHKNKAITFKIGFSDTMNQCFSDCNSTIYINSLNIKARSIKLKVGILWLLEKENHN